MAGARQHFLFGGNALISGLAGLGRFRLERAPQQDSPHAARLVAHFLA